MDEAEIENYRGDSLQLDILAEDESGTPVDFTDATFRIAIGTTPDIDEGDATITNGGTAGTVSIFIGYDKMETLALGEYVFDVEATWETEKRRETLVYGTLSIIEDVSV